MARFGGDLPAVDIELFLVISDGSLGGDLPLAVQVALVADHHHHNLVDIQVVIWVRRRVPTIFIQEVRSR